MVKTIKPKSQQEWLEHRKGGIGSSEVATIIGLNPYETPYQLWLQKTGQAAPKQQTFAMKAGHYLEDAVARFWSDETHCEIIKSSRGDFLILDDERPFMRVSPDRTYWLPDRPKNSQNKGILECKTTQMKVDGDDLPKHWFCQLQYQLGVAGLEEGSLAWLCSGREFGYKNLKFVPDFFAWLTEEVERFWTDYILGEKEPPMVSVVDVITKYSRHTDGKVIEVDDAIYTIYKHLKQVKYNLSALEEEKTHLEDKLKLGFGDAEAISYGGVTLATWKATKDSEKFDAKRFQSENPEVAAQYMETVKGTRRFLLK